MDSKLSIHIAQALEQDIVTGRLLPGTRLQQEALALQFQVSRQPIRTALEILQVKQLVSLRPDRSVEVEAISRAAVDEIIALRVLLETEALDLALPHLEEHAFLAARQQQERLELESDPKNLAELDIAFHMALYQPCGNARLLMLIEQYRRENRRAYLGQPPGSDRRKQWNQDHRELLAACRAHEAERAKALLQSHILRAKERLQ